MVLLKSVTKSGRNQQTNTYTRYRGIQENEGIAYYTTITSLRDVDKSERALGQVYKKLLKRVQ